MGKDNGSVSNTENYIGTPWGIILCVDYYQDEKINGRIYHRYQTEPIRVGGMLEAVFEIDAFFDRLGYPFPGTNITSAFSGLSSINMKSSICFRNSSYIIFYVLSLPSAAKSRIKRYLSDRYPLSSFLYCLIISLFRGRCTNRSSVFYFVTITVLYPLSLSLCSILTAFPSCIYAPT